MRCHQHFDTEAVAVCVSCGRGVCRGCQQPTLDQRMLCGLPQCAALAKKQAAVPFVIAQDCANRATYSKTLVQTLRGITLILAVPSVLLEIILLVTAALRPQAAMADSIVLAGLGIILILLAGVTWRFQSQLSLLQNNWEDLAGEFGSGAVDEPPAST
ncbi:MAG: hypothetical protein HY290_01400 [Planctomycetia bacterium]|nr:hypothetical protein [Planctomycetia bacterium]